MDAQEAAAALAPLLPLRVGTLKIFDDWFGRPADNIHSVIAVRAESNTLILEFDEGERLTVEDAAGVVLDPQAPAHRLTIERASRVMWTWYFYGRPKEAENLYVEEHWIEGNKIMARSSVDWYVPVFNPSPQAPAVEFV
jgi:hypothetical protein